MEFPFGHHHHRHGHGEEEEEARRRGEPYYPPPGHNPYRPDAASTPGWEEYQPPPPPPHYADGDGGRGSWGTHQAPRGGYEPGGPGYSAVQHVAHEVRPEEESGGRHEGWRHGHGGHGGPFSFIRHIAHESHGSGGGGDRQRTVRVFTKAAEDYSLSVRDGRVILARADHRDEYQHWIKDETFSTRVKDEEGLPGFALINKVTGEAIKHSIGATHPVRLIPHNPNYLDESILWTESHDTGGRFRCIRMVNNIRLNFDAFHGDEDHGGVHDGTIVVLWEWLKGKNQRWKIVPY